MATKRHNCKLTEEMLRQIEYVLPKLKYSVYIRQVTNWLENFEEQEALLALDFLFYLEYIPFSELQSRLNDQLDSLNKCFNKRLKFLLVPYAKYPKSNDIILYLISKCPAYNKLKKANRIDITLDIENYLIKDKTVLVYVDDFIGTGKSFKKWYKSNKITKNLGAYSNIHDEQALLSAIIMEDGSQFLKYYYPDIRVFAEFRPKIFCSTHSPFNLSCNRADIRRLCLKYGNKIATGFQRPNKTLYSPLGYENSEALVAFDYGTPNNSLSIIWGDDNWNPIFPRSAKSRMKKASEIKSEAAFYLGLMHKLQISFEGNLKLTDSNNDFDLSARDAHAILVYLCLVNKHLSHLLVCQVLGISVFELNRIISKACQKGLVNREGLLTRKGVNLLRQLKRTSNSYKFRENDKLDIRDDKIFVPKSFRKIT